MMTNLQLTTLMKVTLKEKKKKTIRRTLTRGMMVVLPCLESLSRMKMICSTQEALTQIDSDNHILLTTKYLAI